MICTKVLIDILHVRTYVSAYTVLIFIIGRIYFFFGFNYCSLKYNYVLFFMEGTINTIRVSTLIIILICNVSCNNLTFKDSKSLNEYANDKRNGLVIKKEKNGFLLEAKFLPSDICAFEEHEANLSSAMFDSLSVIYSSCRSFVFNISTKENMDNILAYKANSLENIKKRQHVVDFRMGNYFFLEIDGEKIYPQLSSAQNVSIGEQRGLKVRLTFVADTHDSPLLKEQDLRLYFDDPFFDTGSTCFTIKNKDILRVPKLKIL